MHVIVMTIFHFGITFAILCFDGAMPDINEHLII